MTNRCQKSQDRRHISINRGLVLVSLSKHEARSRQPDGRNQKKDWTRLGKHQFGSKLKIVTEGHGEFNDWNCAGQMA